MQFLQRMRLYHKKIYFASILLFFDTIFANSIYYRFLTLYIKTMLSLYMVCNLIHKITLKMKYPATFCTLKMKMLFTVMPIFNILVCCLFTFFSNILYYFFF